MTEKELEKREKELLKREKALEKRERELDPISKAVQAKKEQWYSKVKLSVKQLDVIIWITGGLLVLVFIMMILESLGLFKLPLYGTLIETATGTPVNTGVPVLYFIQWCRSCICSVGMLRDVLKMGRFTMHSHFI